MLKIFILVGPIASGKSSYCKNAAWESLIMNDDAIVNLLHGGNYNLYNDKLKILYKSIENHIVTSALCVGKSVVIDRGLNVSVKGRKRWVSLAHSFDTESEAIVFPRESPRVHAERRYKSDARGHTLDYWLKVATKHDDIYEEPTLAEGFNLIHKITFDDIQRGFVVI